MGMPESAKDFLERFAADFGKAEIRQWQWSAEDDEAGKVLSWDVFPYAPAEGQIIEVNASVDLQLTQLSLSISEREMAEGATSNTDTHITYDALVQFEDRTLVVNGEEREYCEEELQAVLREFFERTA